VFLLVAIVAVGTATPDHLGATATTQLVADVTAAAAVTVRCDLTPIGDIAKQPLYDDGVHGDGGAGDRRFGLVVFVAAGTPLGDRSLPCLAIDADGAVASFAIALTVTAACGDDVTQSPETCDDGGVEDADGCDATCHVEPGWVCLRDQAPSLCLARCGDGAIVGPEECDDGNHHVGDGCDRGCATEPGFACTGAPSTCVHAALCGDGSIEGDEHCDDGNAEDLDGCDSTCTVETAWECTGEPSRCCTVDGQVCATSVDAGAPDGGAGLDEGGGGCCSTTDGPAGSLALTAVALLWWRRQTLRST
jgi:cysteine-rich repeat protein